MPKELVQILIQTADIRFERIISHGHASAADFWYDQPQHEWVIVLKGAARLQFEDGVVEMKLGDFINIPAFYVFPKGAQKQPALLHLHGGGQRVFLHEVAKNSVMPHLGLPARIRCIKGASCFRKPTKHGNYVNLMS